MPGTKIGGKHAAQTNKKLHGKDFYARIGAIGGKLGHTGGFYDKELARRAGKLGGLKSRRGPAKPKEDEFLIKDSEVSLPISLETKAKIWDVLRRKV